MSILNNNYKENLLIFFVIGLFLIEFVTTAYTYFLELKTVRIVGVYKLVFQCFLLSIISYKKIPKNIYYPLLLLISIFIVNQIINPLILQNFDFQVLRGSIYYLDRFIFIFIFILVFITTIKNTEIINRTLKYIEFILIINAFFIIIGVVTEIDFFDSYSGSSVRFGSDGLFNKVNEVSFIYMIYITHLYLQYLKEKSKLPLLVFITFSSLLLGTKTVFLFLFLLLVFHFVYFLGKKQHWIRFVSVGLLLIVIVFFKQITSTYFYLFTFWKDLSNQYDLITLLFSKRDLLFLKNVEYVESSWYGINYFIGGPFYTEKFRLTQMDGPDLYLFFGLIGVLLYFYLCSKLFFEQKNKIKNSVISIVFICGLFGGALLMSVVSLIYLYLVSKSLEKNNTQKLLP